MTSILFLEFLPSLPSKGKSVWRSVFKKIYTVYSCMVSYGLGFSLFEIMAVFTSNRDQQIQASCVREERKVDLDEQMEFSAKMHTIIWYSLFSVRKDKFYIKY